MSIAKAQNLTFSFIFFFGKLVFLIQALYTLKMEEQKQQTAPNFKHPTRREFINVPKIVAREIVKEYAQMTIEQYDEKGGRMMVAFSPSSQAILKIGKAIRIRNQERGENDG